MMKSWADVSSDEDTDDNDSVEEQQHDDVESIGEDFSDKVRVGNEDNHQQQQQQPPQVRSYDFPDRPPFTAFVGNLSYDIQDTSQLQQALADVVFDRLGERVNVLSGRISYDRDSNNRQHRGFGYVELETLEQLKTVMKLNDDGQAILAGRKIQVDTANHQNRSNNNNNNHRGSFNNDHQRRNINRHESNDRPAEKIDGSKFRGGKFNTSSNSSNNNNSSINNNGPRNNSFRGNGANNNTGAPRERPSLKLAPRSKPVDGGVRSSASNIFGGAKARDQQAWEKVRQQQKQQHDGEQRKQEKAAAASSGGDEKKTTKKHSDKGEEDSANRGSGDDTNRAVGKNRKGSGEWETKDAVDNKHKNSSQHKRQSGRGGAGGRGGKGGRGHPHRGGSNNNNGRGDPNNKRGSTRKQQEKKNDKKQQQPSPEEKAAAAAAAAAKTNKNEKPAESAPSNPEPKAPKNKFELLMGDSDSD